MTRRTNANSPEHIEQVKIFSWRDRDEVISKYPMLASLHAVPNGIPLFPHERTFFKREGLTAGIPDLCLPVQLNGYGSLRIEMKSPTGGVLSTEQIKMLNILQSCGNYVAVCNSGDLAISLIIAYLEEMSEVLTASVWNGQEDIQRRKRNKRMPIFASPAQRATPTTIAPIFNLDEVEFKIDG
jgi:hypothetical protein